MEATDINASRPPFVADRDSLSQDGGHTIDWANVPDTFRSTPLIQQDVVVGAAGALANATTVPVDALSYAIPSGTTLRFGVKKFATLTADAAAGATSLAVEALATALVDNDTATHTVQVGAGDKFIPAGTRMAETADGLIPRDGSNPATCLLATNANENSRTDARTGYGVIRGGVIYENMLPGASGDPAVILTAEKTELAAAGTGFAWLQYADSTAG